MGFLPYLLAFRLRSFLRILLFLTACFLGSGCGFRFRNLSAIGSGIPLQGKPVPGFGSSNGYVALNGAFTPEEMVVDAAGNSSVLLSTIASGLKTLIAATEINSDGTVNESFGSLGLATAPLGNLDSSGLNFSMATAGIVQSDGRVLVAATTDIRWCGPSVLARFMPDGTLDTTFGGSGTGIGPSVNACLNSLNLLSNGKILGMGGYPGIDAVEFNPDGTLDTGFGVQGIATIPSQPMMMSNYNYGALESDGGFFLYGLGSSPLLNGIGMAHFNGAGILDLSYGSSGESISAFASLEDVWGGVISNGQLVIVASTSLGTIQSMNGMLSRYSSTGALDPSFGTNGAAAVIFSQEFGGMPSAILTDYAGNIYVGGTTNLAAPNPNLGGIVQILPSEISILRFLPTGAPDPSFGNSGRIDLRIGKSTGMTTMAFTADGQNLLVLGGSDGTSILAQYQ